MNRPRVPPFVDLHGVLESIQCWRQGVDVYVSSPCDALHRRFNYSPMLLRMSFLPSDGASITAIGLGLAGAFLVSLGFLP